MSQSNHRGQTLDSSHLDHAPYAGSVGPSIGAAPEAAVAALSAGNTCILKLSEALPATSDLPRELVPRYFDPRAVTTASGNRDRVTELLKLPFITEDTDMSP